MRLFWAVLAFGLIGLQDIAAREPDSTIVLRILAHASLNATELNRARETATALLATAGIRGNWRDCAAADCDVPVTAPAVTVLLLPVENLQRGDVGGAVTRDPVTAEPSILIFIPSIAARAQSIRSTAFSRGDPTLSAFQTGHLTGIVIAHEVGHVLGLGHAAAGVMKPRLDIDDFLAWRRSDLAFSPVERTIMRAAAAGRTATASRVQ